MTCGIADCPPLGSHVDSVLSAAVYAISRYVLLNIAVTAIVVIAGVFSSVIRRNT